MYKIIAYVVLALMLVSSVFYIKFLRSKNTILENSVNIQKKQIAEMSERAKKLDGILHEREKELQKMGKSQKDFKNELTKAKNNEDFKIWFDAPLPDSAYELLKKDGSD